MRRRYHGSIYVDHCYRGEKSVSLVVPNEMGIKLAIAVLTATQTGRPFDLAIFDKARKKIQLTVTSM